MPVSPELAARIQDTYPWMNQEMLDAYIGSWSEIEDTQVALQAVRQTASYDVVFPGNMDPVSGQPRMTESEYFATKAAYDAVFVSVDLNPAYFQDEWITALEGEVSPTEMMMRLDAAYERVIQAAPEIKAFYADNYGIDMTDSAILASVLSPDLNDKILSRQISVAEIGGTGIARGLNVSKAFAEMMAEQGITKDQSADFFGQSANLIPAMNIIAARHADPDDDFDLNDASAAFLFDDPETRRRIRRLQAQERSTFTGGATTDITRDRSGMSGLTRQ